jgi:hypothetical protein
VLAIGVPIAAVVGALIGWALLLVVAWPFGARWLFWRVLGTGVGETRFGLYWRAFGEGN